MFFAKHARLSAISLLLSGYKVLNCLFFFESLFGETAFFAQFERDKPGLHYTLSEKKHVSDAGGAGRTCCRLCFLKGTRIGFLRA